MSTRCVRGGFVLLDLETRRVVRASVFQYNPETLRRTLVPAAEADGAVEVVQVELVLDATDRLSAGEMQPAEGIQPQLATLESIAFPPRALAQTPLTMLVWGRARVLPVRVTELVTVEQAFDHLLHPIRATAAVTMEVVRPDASEHAVVRAAHEERERLAVEGAQSLDDLEVGESLLFEAGDPR